MLHALCHNDVRHQHCCYADARCVSTLALCRLLPDDCNWLEIAVAG